MQMDMPDLTCAQLGQILGSFMSLPTIFRRPTNFIIITIIFYILILFIRTFQ